MTSEIAILNKTAVAVAADSAVTVGKSKIHRSANKIFVACDEVPVGIMIYGYADFSGIPWETLVKLFRNTYKHKNTETIEKFCKPFFKFIQSSKFLTERSQAFDIVLFSITVLKKLQRRLVHLSAGQRSKRLLALIDGEISQYQGLKSLTDIGCPSLRSFQQKYSSIIQVVSEDIFDDISYQVPRRARGKIVELVYEAIQSQFLSEYRSGVVFFGFGEKEIMPSLYSFEVDGCPFGKIRSVAQTDSDIRRDEEEVSIIPFADRDVMDIFMQGISRDMSVLFRHIMEFSSNKMAERIINGNFTINEDQYKVIQELNKPIINDLVDKSIRTAERFIYKQSVGPILNIVKNLPKEDMATLAEALVEVTALRKRVSSEIESVGGPVDVAVVTKGDGLIWIKRKHYFDMDKNHHYLYHRFGNVSPLGA